MDIIIEEFDKSSLLNNIAILKKERMQNTVVIQEAELLFREEGA